MEALLNLLKKQGLSIGSCESFTAGLFCAHMAAIPGASAVLKGGIVTYATSIKTDVVHVDQDIVERFGVISMECAKEMALKAKALLDVDVCVSFTGNAGPGTMEGKASGLVYGGIAFQDQVVAYEFYIDRPRNEVREEAVRLLCEKVKILLS